MVILALMQLNERAKQVVWPPFTQLKKNNTSIAVKQAKDAVLTDYNGQPYIDAISSWWTTVHGHSHPYIGQAVAKQYTELDHVIFAGFTHEPAIKLAEKLLEKLPSNQAKVFFSDNGSTAVEVALKMAFQYWFNQGEERLEVIAFKHAYHGDTFGAMSVGERGGFTEPFKPFLFDVHFIEVPTPENFNAVKQAFTRLVTSKKVAAFIFEPLVLGAGGMLMYTPQQLNELIRIAQANNVICIADEVMTGFYRTGKLFASDYLTEKPDIFCLSKGLTGGTMAMSVTTATQRIYNAFLSDEFRRAFLHGHSFTANPLTCAAALASLELFEQAESKQNISHLCAYYEANKTRISKHKLVENFRLLGTILAFDIRTEQATSYFNNLRDYIYNFCLERNVLLRPLGNTLYILPPYCITKEQLDTVFNVIEELLDSLG